MKLGITFRRFDYKVCAIGKTQCDEYVDDVQFSAARRAITRAAAEIGKAMP